MSEVEPMGLRRRLAHYSPRDLTPAQRQRAWHKAHRNGERGSDSEVLYGRKGHATPRQRKPHRDA